VNGDQVDLLQELKRLGFTQQEVYFMFCRRLLSHRKAGLNDGNLEDELLEYLDIIVCWVPPIRRVWEDDLDLYDDNGDMREPPAALYLHAYPKLAIEEDPEDKQ